MRVPWNWPKPEPMTANFNSQSLYEAARARLQAQCVQLGLELEPWQLDIVAQAVVRDAERWQIPTDPYEETNP